MLIRSVLPFLLVARAAVADPHVVELAPVCAAVDPADDLKDDAARDASRRLLIATLEQAELLVVETGCVETFRVSHRKAGAAIDVRIDRQHGSRSLRTIGVDKLPAIYQALVQTLLREPDATATIPVPELPAPAPTRSWDAAPPAPFGAGSLVATSIDEPTTKDPRQPARISLWYLRLGGGAANGVDGGMLSSIGWRRLLGDYAVDIALTGLASDTDAFTRGTFQVFKFKSRREVAVYYGAGLAIESVRIGEEYDYMSSPSRGSGVGLATSVGLALNRGSSSGQFFLQADVGLPFYTATGGRGEYYPASFGMSLGFGFGRR